MDTCKNHPIDIVCPEISDLPLICWFPNDLTHGAPAITMELSLDSIRNLAQLAGLI